MKINKCCSNPDIKFWDDCTGIMSYWCKNCGAKSTKSAFKDKEKATEYWNNDHPDIDELKAELETYKKALEMCNHSRNMSEMKNAKTPFPNCYIVDHWLAKAKECK